MHISKTTLYTTLAGLGIGAATTYFASQHHGGHAHHNGRYRLSKGARRAGKLWDTGTKAAGSYLGGRAAGLSSSLGSRLAAAYLASKAAKAEASDAAHHYYDDAKDAAHHYYDDARGTAHHYFDDAKEAAHRYYGEGRRRGGDAYRVLRGRPVRYSSPEHGSSVTAMVVVAGLVGLGAAFAAVLHNRDQLDARKLRQTASDATRQATRKAKRWVHLGEVDDDTLTDRIRQKIDHRSGLSFTVQDATVTVRGDVPDFQREDVLSEIRSVEGVKSVEDRLSTAT